MSKESTESANQKSFKEFIVVIVDDDEGLNYLINKKLKRSGFQTKSAFTGNEALSIINQNSKQILLIDYKLPDMTGKELVEKLRREHLRMPQFFVMTGFGDEKIAVEMMKLGASDYILKDADFINVLIVKLQQQCTIIEEQNRLIKAEQALKESELNYRYLYENMSQGVVYQNENGEIISANSAAERILGLDYSQMIGATSMDAAWKALDENKNLLSGDKHPAMVALKKAKPVENFLMGIYNPKIKDHTWIIVNSIPLFKENQTKPYRVFSTFTDVTKRINTEEELKAINQQLSASEQQLIASNQQLIASELQLLAANQQLKAAEIQLKETNKNLKESEKQFRQLFENLEQGFALHEMIYDDKNNPVDYRFVLINKSFENLTGIDASDYIGKTVKQVLPDIEQEWIENYGKVAKTGKPLHFEHFSNDFNKYYGVIAYSPKKNFFATIFTDTTKDKLHQKEILEAKRKAEENEAMLMAALENSQAGIAIAEVPSGKLKFVNKAGLLIRDKKYDEIVNDIDLDKYVSSWKILDFDGKPLKTEEVPLARAVLYGETNSREFIVRRDNNEDRMVWANAAPIINDAGKQIAAIVVFLDITDRKKAENEIAEQKLLFETMFNTIEDGIVVTDKNRKILHTNSGIEKTFGYKPEEIIGKKTQILYADKEKFVETGNNVYGENPQSTEKLYVTSYRNKNNAIFPGETFGARLHNPKGEYIGNIGIIRDITERLNYIKDIKDAKKLAERNEQDLQLLFDNMHQGFALHKIIYNEQNKPIGFKFIRVSPAYEKITQRNIREHIGKNVFDVFPDTNKMWLQIFNEISQTGEDKQFEYYDAKINKYYLINAFRPKPKYFAVLITDITSMKEYEKDLILAKEKAEEGDRLKSAFLANMSHEIRTPMNGILGFTNLLKEPNLTPDEMQKYIGIIQKSGNRMLSTINDLIDISKIETGQVELNLKKTDLIKEVEESIDFFSREARKKGLSLTFINKLNDSDRFIKTDQQKFDSILTNLVKNAIKYTDRGSIVISIERNNDQLICKVKDTGIGIPQNRQEAIFDRFVQADIEDLRALEGSGLGLAITKAYVEMLGGSITLESKINVGSTFTVTIPFLSEEISTQQKSTEATSVIQQNRAKNLNILVVEDDEVSFLYLSTLLEKYTSKVKRAVSGQEAVEICKSDQEIDLILMDIKIPVMDGYETTKKIREFNPDVVIIAQTAHALEDDRSKAIKAGCDDYIAKPINKLKLFNLIDARFNS